MAKIRFNIRSPLFSSINGLNAQAKGKIAKYLVRWP
jgi:hypothetical protein